MAEAGGEQGRTVTAASPSRAARVPVTSHPNTRSRQTPAWVTPRGASAGGGPWQGAGGVGKVGTPWCLGRDGRLTLGGREAWV